MKILVAIILGFFLGLLISLELRIIFASNLYDKGKAIIIPFTILTILCGWALTSYLIAKGAKSISKVFSRGFLIGAVEWLIMIPVSFISGSHALVKFGQAESGGAVAAIIGGGIFAFLTGGVAIGMTVLCLIAFVISHSLGKEMRPEETGNTKKCTECAEMIKPDAKKCRFCGATLT